jgi:multicomponent Na+:H+ antiporter subunit C
VVVGVALLTNAVNLLVFTAAGLSRAGAPLVQAGESAPPPGTADPLPQAFILTAIVIGFGVLAFFVTLAMRVYQTLGIDDTDGMKATDT